MLKVSGAGHITACKSCFQAPKTRDNQAVFKLNVRVSKKRVLDSMEYIFGKNFLNSKNNLKKSGGPFTRAANMVDDVIAEIADARGSSDHDFLAQFTRTTNGESRIKKCIKYALSGQCRLVTVRHEDRVIFLYLGNHSDTDKWLDKNNGTDFTKVNKEGQLTPVRIRPNQSNPREISFARNLSADETLMRRIL